MGRKLNKSQETFLRNQSKNWTIEELARKLQITPREVSLVLRDLGLEAKDMADQKNSKALNVSDRLKDFFERSYLLVAALMAVVYTAYFFALCYFKYTSFAYNDFDLAIHVQTLWNILHGSIQLSILGLPFLGNHAHFIHFLLAPLYACFQSPLFLLFIQSLLLGFSIIPLYLLGKHWKIPGGGLVIGVAYLLYPALGYMNLYEFHPTALSTFFLFWVCWAFETGRFKIFWFWAVLAILCQENLPLVIFMFGPMAWIKKRNLKWILSPMILGGFIFFFLTGWFLPHLNKGLVGFESIYAHLGKGPVEILQTIVYRPFYVLGLLLSSRNFDFLGQLFFPVALLPFLRPVWLVPALPLFLQHLLSSRATEQTILYHYQAELIPFIFVSMLLGYKALISMRFLRDRNWMLGTGLVLWSLVFNLMMGPHFKVLGEFEKWKVSQQDRLKDQWSRSIPQDQSVMCTFEFLSHLANRSQLYSFHHFYSGRYTLSEKEYKPPEGIDFLLIDAMDHLTYDVFLNKEGDDRTRNYIQSEKFGLIQAADDLLFYEKDKPSKEVLWNLLPKTSEQAPKIVLTGGLQWFDAVSTLKTESVGKIAHIRWSWGVEKPMGSDYWIAIRIYNAAGQLILERYHSLGYHQYPLSDWKDNEIYEENYHLLLPEDLPKGNYLLQFEVVDRLKAWVLQVEKKSEQVSYDQKGILIGTLKID